MSEHPVYIVFGYPGVGKSAVAGEIALSTEGTVLDTDEIRKYLFEQPDYSAIETQITYSTLLLRARHQQKRTPTVIEGTFSNSRYREMANMLPNTTWLRVRAEPKSVKERISQREGISDADYGVYEMVKKSFDRPVNLDYEVIDNSGEWAQTREQVRSIIYE